MEKINSFDDLKRWVRAKKERTAKIELGEPINNEFEHILVFDYDLMKGEHITIPGEISLYDNFEKNINEEIQSLQNRLARFKEGN